MLGVDVNALSLTPTLRADPEVGEVWVEVDLVDIGDRAALTTQRLRKMASPLDFRYSYSVPIAPGSAEQATLRRVMDSTDEQESDVYFELKTSGRSGKGDVQIGQGFLNLKQLLSQGRDFASVPVQLQGRKGVRGLAGASQAGFLKLRVPAARVGGAHLAHHASFARQGGQRSEVEL